MSLRPGIPRRPAREGANSQRELGPEAEHRMGVVTDGIVNGLDALYSSLGREVLDKEGREMLGIDVQPEQAPISVPIAPVVSQEAHSIPADSANVTPLPGVAPNTPPMPQITPPAEWEQRAA